MFSLEITTNPACWKGIPLLNCNSPPTRFCYVDCGASIKLALRESILTQRQARKTDKQEFYCRADSPLRHVYDTLWLVWILFLFIYFNLGKSQCYAEEPHGSSRFQASVKRNKCLNQHCKVSLSKCFFPVDHLTDSLFSVNPEISRQKVLLWVEFVRSLNLFESLIRWVNENENITIMHKFVLMILQSIRFQAHLTVHTWIRGLITKDSTVPSMKIHSFKSTCACMILITDPYL